MPRLGLAAQAHEPDEKRVFTCLVPFRIPSFRGPRTMSYDRIVSLLGDEAESLLTHTCEGIPADRLHKPSPNVVDEIFAQSDRKPSVLVNLQRILDHGRLGGTGYVSILPVDQGIEHTGG